MNDMSLSEIVFNGETYVKKSSVKNLLEISGDYVVIRTYSAGVHAGHLKERNGKEVTLTNARRLWKWEGASSLSQIAGEGISKPESCKFPAAISAITLTEAIEIIPCTAHAEDVIKGVKEWKS